MKSQTGSLWTWPHGVKPIFALSFVMWDLRSSEILHSVEQQFLINVSGLSIGPIFERPEIQKRDHNMTEVNWYDIPFWDFVHHVMFDTSTMFHKQALFLLSGKEAPNLLKPLQWVILNHWEVPENRSSPRVVTGKWLLKNLKLSTRFKNKTWNNPQIKNL